MGLQNTNASTETQLVRPVINIKANTLFSGTGTATDPYKIVTE